MKVHFTLPSDPHERKAYLTLLIHIDTNCDRKVLEEILDSNFLHQLAISVGPPGSPWREAFLAYVKTLDDTWYAHHMMQG